jgi:hypothetical protein
MAFVWSPADHQFDNITFPFSPSILCFCSDIPMRWTASHGPAQSHMHNNHNSLELWNGREHQKAENTYFLNYRYLSPETISRSLRQYSLSEMGLRMTTYLIIALLQSTTTFGVVRLGCPAPPSHLIAASTIPILLYRHRHFHAQGHIH